jgi:hypothetical protein
MSASQAGSYGSNGSVGIKLIEGNGVADAGSILFYDDGNAGFAYKGGNVGIGTTNVQSKLHIAANSAASVINLQRTNSTTGGSKGAVAFSSSDGYITSSISDLTYGVNNSGVIVFRAESNSSYTSAYTLPERMRITPNGEAILTDTSVNTTPPATPSSSNSFNAISLRGLSGQINLSSQNNHCLDINRKISDGTLVVIRHEGTQEGSISVSGTTVSYNGGHLSRWSQLISNQADDSIVKGTVMSNLDEMCEWKWVQYTYNGEIIKKPYDGDGYNGQVIEWEYEGKTHEVTIIVEDNEQLNKTKVSDVEGDVNVAGVFVSWDEDGDMNMAMTGDMVIRVGKDVTVNRGDLLMSAGDGTAKPQGDDIVRSKTIAKVTSTHVTRTYDDGSYLVPCVLMAC